MSEIQSPQAFLRFARPEWKDVRYDSLSRVIRVILGRAQLIGGNCLLEGHQPPFHLGAKR